MMNDDKLRDFVQRANRDPLLNGQAGPPPAERRPSGWVCPRCGQEADQAADPVMLGGQPMGWSYRSTENVPDPIAVIAQEVLERDEEGNITREYRTRHCLNCFNTWQRQQMMRDIRANVPQLVRKPDAEPDRS